MTSMTIAQNQLKSSKSADRQVREVSTFVDLNSKDMVDNLVWDQIGTPFTATDIYGNTVSLQSYLDAGKCVIIDYSCTWCPPCWNLHTSGLLEQLNALDDIQVIWVESESSNTTAQIFGPAGGSSYSDRTLGDWTHSANGDSIEYPIIDDDAQSTCLATCQSLYEGYVPSVFFIAPNGYFCSIYNDEGFISYNNVAASIANVQALVQRYPRAGQAPIVRILGNSSVVKGSPAQFAANIVSVDPITSIAWTFSNGTPATASTETATTTWNAAGTQQVTLTVTNASGSTTATLDVNVIEWNWGNEMSYCGNGAYVSSIGNGREITWGVKFPAAFMANRNYLENVKAYLNTTANYTLKVYQTNASSPSNSDIIYQHTYNVTGVEDYTTLTLDRVVALDNSKDLWVALTCSTVDYPATGTDFCGDPNGSYVCLRDQWELIYNLNPDLQYTWMIKATTSETAPTPVSIDATEATNVVLYPNPTTSVLNIEADGVQEVSVVDLSGRTVMNVKNTKSINMSNLANGVYYVRVITNNGISSQKVIKK